MLLEEGIRLGDVLVIPARIPRLVAAQKQDSDAARVEGVQDAIGLAAVLHPQFPHVVEPGAAHRVCRRPG